jgi:hypothetical protein
MGLTIAPHNPITPLPRAHPHFEGVQKACFSAKFRHNISFVNSAQFYLKKQFPSKNQVTIQLNKILELMERETLSWGVGFGAP